MIQKVVSNNAALLYVPKREAQIYQNTKLLIMDQIPSQNLDIKVGIRGRKQEFEKKNNLVTVFFRGEQIGEGHGTSIQQAEKHAARKALEKYYFPQREWQQYYIKHKMDKGDKKHKKEKPIVPNWNPKECD